MARWTGPVFGFALALLAGANSLAAPGAEPSRDGSNGDTVQRATYQTPTAARSFGDSSGRAAAPAPPHRAEAMPINAAVREDTGADRNVPHNGRRDLPPAPSAGPAIISMLGSLAIVLGLFFALVWFMRRGLPKGSRVLPSDVVEVLGRAPLAARQQMHLVRFGHKLLLVSVSAGGAETLSEIIEPAEVDRLAGICQQAQPNSATNAFRQVFRQFGDRSGRLGGGPDKTAADSASRRIGVPTVMEDDDV
jgi:flagellar biogenesis protein FliO